VITVGNEFQTFAAAIGVQYNTKTIKIRKKLLSNIITNVKYRPNRYPE